MAPHASPGAYPIRAQQPVSPVPGPSVGAFRDYRCNAEHFEQAFVRAGGYRSNASEFMAMMRLLTAHRLGDFANIADLHAQACGQRDTQLRAATVAMMRDLFLELPNARLQNLYRDYFQKSPPPSGMPHCDKIATLDNVRDSAESFVSALDWHWLAEWLQLHRIGETVETCLLRLSNFALRVARVNFRFTYHCNIICRHCYNTSGPHAKAQRLDLDAMLKIVADMPDAGISALNLSGGEPFLYLDDLLALISAGRAARLKQISIYTNGFWAVTRDKTDQMLAALVQAGFMKEAGDHLKVSAGTYHQEFIAFDRIRRLGERYHHLFKRRLPVDYELAPGQQSAAEGIRRKLSMTGSEKCIALTFREISPLGRGTDLPGATSRPIDTPCHVIDHITFDPDGAVRPCCGFNNENYGVKIGDIRLHSLRELIKRMQNDPILQFLARNPMASIFEHVNVTRNASGYAGKCNLCQHALGKLADKESLQASLFNRQEFYPFWFSGRMSQTELQS